MPVSFDQFLHPRLWMRFLKEWQWSCEKNIIKGRVRFLKKWQLSGRKNIIKRR